MAALDEFAKIPLSRKIAAVAVLLAIIGVVYYFVRYQSLASTYDGLVETHDRLQTQERQFLEKRQRYEADVRRLAQIREQFASQSRVLPPDAEMSTFLESLNNHAELAGLEIALVEPQEEEGQGFYAKIPVELHLRGRYHELAKFFYNVGQLERIINVENINLAEPARGQSAEEEDENEVLIQAEVMATTFRSLEEGDSAGAQPTAVKAAAPAARGGR